MDTRHSLRALEHTVVGPDGRDTGGSCREWERYRGKLKGMGEIEGKAEGNGRDTGGS
jgi:hypothetical protein